MRAGYRCVRILIALVVIVLVPLSVNLSAQTYQGGLRGLVKDAQGVIPGVEVTLVNEDTNAVRSATDQRRRRVLVHQRPAGHLHRARRRCRASGPRSARGCASPRSRSSSRTSRSKIGGLSEQITVTGADARGRTRRPPVATTMTAAQITAHPDLRPQHVLHARSPRRASSSRATRSSSATRTSPARRCCRSAADRAAATPT